MAGRTAGAAWQSRRSSLGCPKSYAAGPQPPAAGPPQGRAAELYACICHAVTTAEVDAAIAVGAGSVRAVRRATGAGQSCGSCVKRLSCQLAAARQDVAAANTGITEIAALAEATDPTQASETVGVAGPVEVPAAPTTPPRPAHGRPVSLPGRVAAAVEHLAGCPAAVPALG